MISGEKWLVKWEWGKERIELSMEEIDSRLDLKNKNQDTITIEDK
jgi:hypothetical protein